MARSLIRLHRPPRSGLGSRAVALGPGDRSRPRYLPDAALFVFWVGDTRPLNRFHLRGAVVVKRDVLRRPAANITAAFEPWHQGTGTSRDRPAPGAAGIPLLASAQTGANVHREGGGEVGLAFASREKSMV